MGGTVFDIAYVRDFIVLADTLSFSETAKRLYSSQSAVSRHIDVMEKALGARLFERSTRKVGLTETGSTVLDAFRAIWENFESIEEATARMGKNAEVIRLSAPSFWLGTIVEPLVEFVEERCPDIVVELDSNDPVRGLDLVGSGMREMAFGAALPSSMASGVAMRPFVEEPLMVTLGSEHLSEGQRQVSLRALSDMQLILVDDGNDGFGALNRRLEELLHGQGLFPRGVARTPQVETLGRAISAYDGYAITPRSVGNMDRSYLACAEIAEGDFSIPLAFYYRADRLNDSIVRFFDAAAEFVRGHSDWRPAELPR